MEEKKDDHRNIEHHHDEVHNKKSISKSINLENIFLGLAVLLFIILIINVFMTYQLNQNFKKNGEDLKEKLRPANIDLVVIKNSGCADCFDVSPLVEYIKTAKVTVTSEKTLEFNSQEAKQLIEKYNIDKIPTVIVTGEIDKAGIQELDKKKNALVFTKTNPPYTNSTNGNIIGRVTVYSLRDTKCRKCDDLSVLISQMMLSGIRIVDQKNISVDSPEGKDLVGKYKINFASTIILSKDAAAYPLIQQVWPRFGSKEIDGSYVLRTVYPPFINLTSGELKGIVDITYLTDKSCTECYNVNVHKQILTSPQSLGIKLDKEETVDIGDGKGRELIAKYNISQVPTIILSSGVSDYPSAIALKQFFSVEKDGSYIFRKPSVVGAYKDLTTNTVVKPQQQQDQGVPT